MASLLNEQINLSYPGLLKTYDNGDLTGQTNASTVRVSDGIGTFTPLFIGQDRLGLNHSTPATLLEMRTDSGVENRLRLSYSDSDHTEIYCITGSHLVLKPSQTAGSVIVGWVDSPRDLVCYGAGTSVTMSWDSSGDKLKFSDNASATFGDGNDFLIYHAGGANYVNSVQGALNIATVQSGAVISIGHTTSETTVNDNLTVTGRFACNGQSVAAAPDYTVSNKTGTDRTVDCNGTLAEIGDNLGQLVDDLIAIGILQ